ncbi:hypothetical protein [Nocardioides sp. Leaf374]|uniref:hypothetical protein n=1 Tax=Nocardioides sp. Leaf374 TaxID=2876560 RepID=UPI001E505948|nr:hypothetical protein [Nocardioides sp. Leaf374]
MPFPDFGPFSVSPDGVAGLGNAFTPFVNRLLASEVQAAGLAGASLRTSYRDNISDEGVDAELTSEIATRWFPLGHSAWQFKAGDLKPAACAAELRGAAFAQEILRSGGQYRLVLGASLTPRKLDKRRAALLEEATTLGLEVDSESIQVLHADSLAAWAESFPALAVWPGLGGNGHGTQTFEGWAASNRHTATFVESEERTAIQESIRVLVVGGRTVDLRLTGVSGLGKTRLTLETFRDSGMENLVVYLKADATPYATLAHLVAQGRTAIVVVDEFTRDQHKSLAEMIPLDSPLRLITIGEPDLQGGLLAPTFDLEPFNGEAMDALIARNQPTLGPELRRVLVETAGGNIGFALFLAQTVSENPDARTADLVTPEAIKQFVSQSLPTGSDFLACGVLALFSRIGYDGDLANELELVAQTFGFTTNDLRSAARSLSQAGLLSTHGRYRAVTPHPMAVHLATAAWEEYSDRIVRDLLPQLTPSMSTRLFRRAADIGEFEPTHSAVVRLLEGDGPFASLQVIEQAGSADLLTELAVMAPREVSRKIATMLAEADEDELRSQTSIRRSLVWTLGKLAWHSYTFDEASDALLRLALAENETWSNNATGNWVELFGLMLPATAAKPAQRLAYLGRAVASDDARVRSLAVRASGQALSSHESIMVAGELQGGVLVEGRGQPETWDEVDTYRTTALDFLAALAHDENHDVATSAIDALISTIHPILEHAQLRDHLTNLLVGLNGSALRRARLELENLGDMFGRVEKYSAETDDVDEVDTAAQRAGLEAMRRVLPDPTPDEELWVVSRMHGWDFEADDFQDRILEITGRLGDPVAAIFGLLEGGDEIPAAFEFGKTLARLTGDRPIAEERLARLAADDRASALVGYLWGRVELGAERAYDDFLDEGAGRALPAGVRLALTGRGPTTEAALLRANALSADRPVAEAVQNFVGLRRDMAPADLARWLDELVPRVESQQDYNALLDFINLSLHRREGNDSDLGRTWLPLLRLRSAFPALGSQSWAWGQLGIRAARAHPAEMARLALELVNQDVLRLYTPDEGAVLKVAVQSGGPEVWAMVMAAVQAGSWKLTMGVDGWFGGLVDVDDVRAWVGDDLDRARAVASVSTAGGAPEMHEVAIYLLSAFPEDRRIESSLYGEFTSGSWTGHESDRINRQIMLVEGWKEAHLGVAGVRHWCDGVLDSLRSRLAVVLREEAEEDWH